MLENLGRLLFEVLLDAFSVLGYWWKGKKLKKFKGFSDAWEFWYYFITWYFKKLREQISSLSILNVNTAGCTSNTVFCIYV